MKNLLSLGACLLICLACGTNATEKPAVQNQPDGTDDVSNLLLKDFRPHSLYKNNETIIEKAKYPVIDLHAHPYANTQEALDEWIKTMDKMGVDKTIVMTYET